MRKHRLHPELLKETYSFDEYFQLAKELVEQKKTTGLIQPVQRWYLENKDLQLQSELSTLIKEWDSCLSGKMSLVD
jgi:hypothetical protein